VLRDFDGFRVLCAVRDGAWGVSGLNQAIERSLADAGLLARHGEWYEGRPVVVTRNDPALGVFNGDIGIVLRATAADGGLRCWFLDGDELRSVSVARLSAVETAFAMTVHKSQGSEFEHVVLVLPEDDVAVLTRELLYTGITRARQAFTLVARHSGLLAAATGRLTRRVSGLKSML
jgi:exodeoxyribonuclease V alpha subunit